MGSWFGAVANIWLLRQHGLIVNESVFLLIKELLKLVAPSSSSSYSRSVMLAPMTCTTKSAMYLMLLDSLITD